MREMRESGVAWMGKIPAEWSKIYLAALFLERKCKNINMREKNLLSLSYGKIRAKNIETTDGLLPASFEGYNIIEPGDIVLRLTDMQNDHRSLRTGLCTDKGIITSAYCTIYLRDNSQDVGFLHYYLHCFDICKGFYGMGSGVRQSLNFDGIRKIDILLPPPDEQIRIRKYLDTLSEKIDDLIVNNEKQIGKLKQYKQSLITEVVTRGLNPDVPMKDSGVEWIGIIPEHWNVVHLRRCASLRSGITLGKKYPENVKLTEMPYLRVANVQSGYISIDNLKTIFVTEEEAIQYCLSAGEVLMTEGGDRDKLGRGCVWNGAVSKCLHQNHIFALKTSKSLNPFFLAYITASSVGRVYFDITAIKTTNLACTNSSKVLDFRFQLPPLDEQKGIVEFLDKKVAQIDALIAIKQAKIEKLTQYKKSLIYEYVTGKKELPDT